MVSRFGALGFNGLRFKGCGVLFVFEFDVTASYLYGLGSFCSYGHCFPAFIGDSTHLSNITLRDGHPVVQDPQDSKAEHTTVRNPSDANASLPKQKNAH